MLLVLFGTTPLCAAHPWLPFGPDGGDARRIAPDPRDHDHLYLGTANGWIYESHNGGNNWTRLAQVGKRDDLVLDSILVDAQNSKHIVVGGKVVDHTDGGIFFSWDGGVTWTNQAEMRGQSVLSLTASVSDPKSMVAGTLQGVFRSTDGGQRWHSISPAESKEIHNVQSVAIDPKDPNIIYAGTWHLPWKTSDGGEHWQPITKDQGIIDDSDVFSIIVDPIAPKIVYASACSGIYKSLDAGGNFTKVKGIPLSARRTRRLLQDPHHLDTVFAGTTEGLYRSDDAGKTWNRLTGPEIIVNDVAVDLADPHRVLIATDRGGVMASDDGGDSFHASNNGFSARQITALKHDSAHPATLFVGVVNDKDWGGVFQSDNGGLAWTQRSEGLAGRDVFSLGQAPDGTMIAGTSHGIYRLDTAAEVWNRVEDAPGTDAPAETVQAILTRPPLPVPGVPTANRKSTKPLTAAQKKAAALKARQKPPVHTASAKSTARKVAPKPTVVAKATPPAPPTHAHSFDGAVYALVTSDRTMLAATSVGLLTSTDNGASWLSGDAAQPGLRTMDWRFLAAAKRNVVAASLRAVCISSDSGTTWTGLHIPEKLTQVSAVAVEPNGELWVGGREGIFVTSDGGATWSTPKNLFLNSVNNIFFDEASNRIMVTSLGNSSIVFTVNLPDKQVSLADTGWNLRFARPMGDHLIAVTLFDGLVIQPRMVASPVSSMAVPPSTAPPVPIAQP